MCVLLNDALSDNVRIHPLTHNLSFLFCCNVLMSNDQTMRHLFGHNPPKSRILSQNRTCLNQPLRHDASLFGIGARTAYRLL